MNAPSTPPVTASLTNPHFTRIGGEEVIMRLVDRFYFHMDTQPDAIGIRAMHPADLGPVKRVLVNFLIEWMGGPKAYSIEHGHPRLRQRHMPFAIGPAERDAWMLCMRAALRETMQDEALIAQLEQSFFKTADFIRNG